MNLPAIKVTQACKSFGRNVVLNGLNMEVPQGATYALLGSSGCGKTTLLSCITGAKTLDSGKLGAFGGPKLNYSQFGYMPQETGLHEELRVQELFNYYAKLYRLNACFVKERSEFLIDLLRLPGKEKLVYKMSGGEKRRLSLAIALLHNARLLVLDEPTVGLDPLLRQTIWDHLFHLVKTTGLTILVTTHYTEEARHADIISVMRNGRILVEENPNSLMGRFDTLMLEEIVLQLCHGQENQETLELQTVVSKQDQDNFSSPRLCKFKDIPDIELQATNTADHAIGKPDICYESRQSSFSERPIRPPEYPNETGFVGKLQDHLLKIWALILVNIYTMYRHPIIMMILFEIPFGSVLFGWIILDGVPVSKFGVVNLEQPQCFNLPIDGWKLGCDFQHYLSSSEMLIVEPHLDESSALEKLNLGNLVGYLVLNENISTHWSDRVLLGKFAEAETLEGSTIHVSMDNSNFLTAGFATQAVYESFGDWVHNKSTLVRGSSASNSDEFPFRINTKFSSHVAKYSDMTVGDEIMSFMLILPSIVGVTIVWDKKRGVFTRSLLTGIRLPHIVIATIISHCAMSTVGFFLCLGTFPFIGFPFVGSLFDLYLVGLGQMIMGAMIGLFLGLFLAHEIEVIFCLLFTHMIMLATASGGFMTLESLEGWVSWYCIAIPLTLPVNAFNAITFQGLSIFHSKVWMAFVVQGVWSAAFLTFSWFTFYFSLL